MVKVYCSSPISQFLKGNLCKKVFTWLIKRFWICFRTSSPDVNVNKVFTLALMILQSFVPEKFG
jgi:hypothetical protein